MGVIVFGSANADLVFPVPELPAPGRTVLGEAWRALPGGKGANQAVAAARDGAAVAFAGAVGRDGMAEVALSALRGTAADLSRVAVVEAPTGVAAICVDPAGRNQIAVASGANAAARASQVEDSALTPGAVLMLQMEVPPAENAALIARARARGVRVLLNLAPPAALPREALAACELVIVNEHEAEWLARHLGCAPDAASLSAALGTAVARTLGEAGAEAAAAGALWRVPAMPVRVVDTTGAGDTWCGVLAAALSRGAGLEPAMRRAAAASALACTREGAAASMPNAAETEAALAGGESRAGRVPP
jgi:ribokinase